METSPFVGFNGRNSYTTIVERTSKKDASILPNNCALVKPRNREKKWPALLSLNARAARKI
jgi:hypothetical protein